MKTPPNFSPRQRPPWWPENEAWPPQRSFRQWRGMGRHNPFFRRMGCLFLLFGFLSLVGAMTLIGFVLGPFIELHQGSFVGNFTAVFPIGLTGVLLLAALVFSAVRGLRRMSMPLDELLEASKRVADGDYSVRVDERGTPEVRSLTEGFNAMAEKLEVNDKQRRNMLADISHELRSPITVMQGNLEGMIDGVYTPDVERLRSLYEETHVLSRLVDDLRTLSLAEAGSLRLQREFTDLATLVRETVLGFETQAAEKAVRLVLDVDEVGAVSTDAVRIGEILRNLLSNALRYTPAGGDVKVGVHEAGSGLERGVTVSVRDTGPGIEAGDLSRIFDRFYKSSDSGGMGLGLSIAKLLVEAHGGRIWAESQPGQGTTISFHLPFAGETRNRHEQ